MVTVSSYLALTVADFEKLQFHYENGSIFPLLQCIKSLQCNDVISYFIYLMNHEILYLLTPQTNLSYKTKFTTQNGEKVGKSFHFHSEIGVFQNMLLCARGNLKL